MSLIIRWPILLKYLNNQFYSFLTSKFLQNNIFFLNNINYLINKTIIWKFISRSIFLCDIPSISFSNFQYKLPSFLQNSRNIIYVGLLHVTYKDQHGISSRSEGIKIQETQRAAFSKRQIIVTSIAAKKFTTTQNERERRFIGGYRWER